MIHRACVLIVALWFPAFASAGSPAEIPDMLHHAETGEVAWIAAEAAIDSSGRFREDLFGIRLSTARRNARLNGTAENCRFFSGPTPDHFKPTNTLEDLATHAETVVSGRIAAARQGFWFGIPGTLIRLRATWLTNQPHSTDTFLFYQLAKIPTAEGLVCAQPLGEFVPPAVGDRVLIYQMGSATPIESGQVLWVSAREVIHESRGRKVLLPKALAAANQEANYDLLERRTLSLIKAKSDRH
ncbi:MAG TPA: hypothetical protein VF618_03345 [Thermoanaerobaculia bacterium]